MALLSAERGVTGKFTVENLLQTAERGGIRNKAERHFNCGGAGSL